MVKEGTFDQYLNTMKERKSKRQLDVFNKKYKV